MKLPINLFLYLASAGLAGGSGLMFYETMRAPRGKEPTAIVDETRALEDAGRKLKPAETANSYTEKDTPWWSNFSKANFTGKLPPKPVARKTEKVKKAPVVSVTPVKDLVTVSCILFDSAGSGTVVVKYRDGVTVEPPDGFAAKPGSYGGPNDVGAPNRPPAASAVRPGRNRGTRPGANRGGNRKPGRPMPAFAGSQAIYQHLQVGDPLWPPHSTLKLAKIASDASAVWFERTGDLPAGAERQEKLFKNEFELDPQTLEQLAAAPIGIRREPRGGGDEVSPGQGKGGAEAGGWTDVGPTTKLIKPGHWNISRQDNAFLRDNADTIFSEDVGMRPYVSRSGGTQGIQVTRVSARMARFGVQTGDVLLELNGVPVHTKSQAIMTGKKLYQRGVRTFTAKILNSYGRVEERTYYAPEK